MESPWAIIEGAPEAAAALTWKRWLGPAFDAVAAACLRDTKRTVQRVPCENGCDCNHRVRKVGEFLVGRCDCDEDCPDIPLTKADVAVWEFDLHKLRLSVAKALGCGAMTTRATGYHRTIQVAALGNPAVPVMLTVQPDHDHYRNAVVDLMGRLPKGFILLTPTKLVDDVTLGLLTRANLGFYDLESHLSLLANGKLGVSEGGKKLFARLVSKLNTPVATSQQWTTIDRLEHAPDFNTVNVDGKPYDLRGHEKARLCIKFLVDEKAFSRSGAKSLLEDIAPYVYEKGNYRPAKIEMKDFFKESSGELSELRRSLVKSAARNGKYYLSVHGN